MSKREKDRQLSERLVSRTQGSTIFDEDIKAPKSNKPPSSPRTAPDPKATSPSTAR